MAIDCEIVVEEGSLGQPSAVYTFDALPRVGEFIRVFYEGDSRRFRVERVEHKAVSAASSGPTTTIHVVDATI